MNFTYFIVQFYLFWQMYIVCKHFHSPDIEWFHHAKKFSHAHYSQSLPHLWATGLFSILTVPYSFIFVRILHKSHIIYSISNLVSFTLDITLENYPSCVHPCSFPFISGYYSTEWLSHRLLVHFAGEG